MRREFAIGFALALLLSGCLSLPVDLGPQSTSKATVTATKTAMASASASSAVDLCCFTVEWSFTEDSIPLRGDLLTFQMYIDGALQPQFTQTRENVSGQISAQRFVTVVPAEKFFGHDLKVTLSVWKSRTNEMGNPTLVNGFTKGPAL